MPWRYPTAGTPYLFSDVMRSGLGLGEAQKILSDFESILKSYLGVTHLALVNSGTTACYVLLEVFKELRRTSHQNEVILPAYTAPSLILPIRAAGLRPVLVDINPLTFNLDINQAIEAINEHTLAVMPVHMFGIPCEIESLNQYCRQRDVFLIEDAASSLGTTVSGRHSGTMAPFGFYSLNRGKNISTLTGGIITWQDAIYTEPIIKRLAALRRPDLTAQLILFLKIVGLSLAVRPLFYTILLPFIARYKYTTLHTTFDSYAFPPVQAAFGKAIWRRAAFLTRQRVLHGRILYSIFSNRAVYQLPNIAPEWEVAFNQFPVLVKDLRLRNELQHRLLAAGLETSLLYEKPLHHIFPELNPTAGRDPFPHATYLAEHLLLIPPHAQLRRALLEKIQTIVDDLAG